MSKHLPKIIDSNEWLFVRFRNGIKLIKADQMKTIDKEALPGKKLGTILNLPVSVYFLSTDGSTVTMNEEGARICGFNSPEDSIGKSLLAVSEEEAAIQLIDNCKRVLAAEDMQVFEEENRRSNTKQQFLSFKAPWYSEEGEVIGVCGISIVLGQHPLAESLAVISELGFLGPNKPSAGILRGVQLTERETDCLRLAMQGLSAKQIAKELAISHRTVEEYLVNVRVKTGAISKAQLLEWAKMEGF